jgi:ATP-dependent Clp protease ATP-binding subunit ClpA
MTCQATRLKALQGGGGTVRRYITDRHLPDKAIDVIDEAGASQSSAAGLSSRKKTISVHDDRGHRCQDRTDPSEERIGLRQGYPASNLERNLNMVVFGSG